MLDPDSVRAFAVAATALWVKGLVLSISQAAIRVRARRFTRPEDAGLLRVATASTEDSRVERLAAAWRNELEASPAAISLAVTYVLLGGAHNAFALALGVYVAARWLQGAAQYMQWQPARTIAWLLGVAATLLLGALVLARVSASLHAN